MLMTVEDIFSEKQMGAQFSAHINLRPSFKRPFFVVFKQMQM